MFKTIKTLIAVTALMSFILAPGSGLVTAADNPCKADFDRLCGDVQPGQGRIKACLKEHKDELSQECKDFLAAKAGEIRAKIDRVYEACKSDSDSLCPGIKPGGGRILRCLTEHKDDLTPKCRTALQQ